MFIIQKICNVQLRQDSRVRLTFQDNARCNKQTMQEWICQQWKPACSGEMLLALDVHKAKTTDAIHDSLRIECNTHLVFVPAGTTSLLRGRQPSIYKRTLTVMSKGGSMSVRDEYSSPNGRVGRSCLPRPT